MLGKYGLVLLKLLEDGLLPRGPNRRCNETVHFGRQKFETEGHKNLRVQNSIIVTFKIVTKLRYFNNHKA